jgi:hypothetical protein
VAQASGKAADAFYFAHDQSRVSDNLVSRRRYCDEASPVAYEQLHAKLFLKQPQLLAYPRLGGVQVIRRSRNVQAVVSNRKQVSEL